MLYSDEAGTLKSMHVNYYFCQKLSQCKKVDILKICIKYSAAVDL